MLCSIICMQKTIDFFSVKNFQLSTLMIPILLTPGAADFVMVSNKQKDFRVCGMEKQRSKKPIQGEWGKLWTGALRGEGSGGKQELDQSEQLTYGS